MLEANLFIRSALIVLHATDLSRTKVRWCGNNNMYNKKDRIELACSVELLYFNKRDSYRVIITLFLAYI